MELAIIYTFLAAGLSYSILKDKEKTKMSFKIAFKVFTRMLPILLIIVGLVGLLLGFVPPETIESYLGRDAGYMGTGIAALFGAVTFIPSLVALPLAGSLLRAGASEMTIAAFITTLTMVGTITAPLEIKELGKKYTLVRNLLSFVLALIIAVVIGLIFA